MKLPDALRGIRQLGFDSVTLIYFVEQHPSYFDRMLFIMRYVDSGPISGIASTLSLAEVLVIPIRNRDAVMVDRYEAVLSKSRGFRLKSITAAIARQAAAIRARYNLKTPDALHIATAIEAGCEAFLTNDLTLKRVTEIRILILDELELDIP